MRGRLPVINFFTRGQNFWVARSKDEPIYGQQLGFLRASGWGRALVVLVGGAGWGGDWSGSSWSTPFASACD